MSRPANNDPHIWAFHETLTTDGSGGWGAGNLLTRSDDGLTITLNVSNDTRKLLTDVSAMGATAVVVDGPGLGQFSVIVSQENTTTLHLETPFDGAVVMGESVVAVTMTSGDKVIALVCACFCLC
jgi:hypothetical protein